MSDVDVLPAELGATVLQTGILRAGAQVMHGGVKYTVWAPECASIRAEITTACGQKRVLALSLRGDGYAVGFDPNGLQGDLYIYDLGEGTRLPDFASRFQPQGINGPSMVVDPTRFQWTDQGWRTPALKGQVLYELHIGTFTPEGTYVSAIQRLQHIRDLGATVVEIMPLAERPGTRNWGYDGVFLFAPTWTYGTPEELRAFVDAAHASGLSVILDVVFNHLGPQGNVAPMYTSHYFHTENNTPWGQNFDLDGPQSHQVRALLKSNIEYWMRDYHFDGFRMDATHAIPDGSPRHLLAELAEIVHSRGGFIIAEDDRNEASILETSESGWGFDGVWADDFHHTARMSQVAPDMNYLESFLGTPEEMARTILHGWLYRGEVVKRTGKNRGTKCDHLSPEKFIYCISNHDQVGNRPLGDRLNQIISIDNYHALSLFFCLLPYTPMLFMGQEWGATTPFKFFTDFKGELGEKMAEYRLKEFQSLGMTIPTTDISKISDPESLDTFLESKLNWAELNEKSHKETLRIYREALALRSSLFPLGNPSRDAWNVESQGNVISVNYWLDTRKVSIHFALKNSGELVPKQGRILMRSSSLDAVGPRSVAVAETIVVESEIKGTE